MADRGFEDQNSNARVSHRYYENALSYLLAVHFNERTLLLRLRQAGVDQTKRNGIAANI